MREEEKEELQAGDVVKLKGSLPPQKRMTIGEVGTVTGVPSARCFWWTGDESARELKNEWIPLPALEKIR